MDPNVLNKWELDNVSQALSITDKNKRIIFLWKLRALRASRAHNISSAWCSKLDGLYTKINISLAILVLFFAGAKISDQMEVFINKYVYLPTSFLTLILGFFGALNVLASALQYANKYSDRGYRHSQSASEFANLQRKIERFLISNNVSDEQVHGISKQYHSIAKIGPEIMDKHWQIAMRFYREIDVLSSQAEYFK